VQIEAVVGFGSTSAPGPTGTVSFFDGSVLLGSVTLNGSNYTAVLNTSSLSAGNHSISANYNGDNNWISSTKSSSITITQRSPGLIIAVNDKTRAASQTNPAFDYVVSGELVNGDTPETAISGGTFSAYSGSTPGYYPINLVGATSANYMLTVVPGTLTVTNDPGSPTNTTISATPSSSMYGDLVTLTGAVSPVTSGPPAISGTIALYEGSTFLGAGTITNGTATFATILLGAGVHQLHAEYGGDLTYSASTSSTVTVTVAKKQAPNGGPALILTVQDETRTYRQVNPVFVYVPSGTLVNNDSFATAISGVPVFTTSATPLSPVGSNYPVALSGLTSQNYVLSLVSGNLTIVPAASATALTPSITATQYGDPITLTATVTPIGASGAVAFLDGANEIGAVTLNAAGTATLTLTTLSAGVHIISAAYLGDGNVGESASPSVTITIAKRTAPAGGPALTITANNATRLFGQGNPTFTYNVTGTLVNGDTYAGAVGGTPYFTTPATLISPVGSYPLSVSNLISQNYEIGYVDGMLTVQKAPSNVVVKVPGTSQTVGTTATFTAFVSNAATGTVTFYDGTAPLGTSQISNGTAVLSTSSLSIGTHNITATYNGDGNYLPSASPGATLIVTPASDFTLLNQTPPQIIPPGASASYTIAISSVNIPFNNPVTLTATNLPTGATYTFTPSSVTPGSSGATSVLKINVANQNTASRKTPAIPLFLATVLLPFLLIRKPHINTSRLVVWLLVALVLLGSATGCGVGGYFNQPEQTYTITITGTSGSLVRSTTAALTVQ
jgi:Bacterial Ig-like domain (group 3)/MBG domain (YGX type)